MWQVKAHIHKPIDQALLRTNMGTKIDGISSSKLYDSSQWETSKWVVVCECLMMVEIWCTYGDFDVMKWWLFFQAIWLKQGEESLGALKRG